MIVGYGLQNAGFGSDCCSVGSVSDGHHGALSPDRCNWCDRLCYRTSVPSAFFGTRPEFHDPSIMKQYIVTRPNVFFYRQPFIT